MKVKAIKRFLGKEGHWHVGDVKDVSNGRADELLRMGHVVRVEGSKEAPSPKNKMEGEAVSNKEPEEDLHEQHQIAEMAEREEGEAEEAEEPAADPSPSSTGGRTGRGRRSSSSPAGQAQKKTSQRSSGRGATRKSKS